MVWGLCSKNGFSLSSDGIGWKMVWYWFDLDDLIKKWQVSRFQLWQIMGHALKRESQNSKLPSSKVIPNWVPTKFKKTGKSPMFQRNFQLHRGIFPCFSSTERPVWRGSQGGLLGGSYESDEEEDPLKEPWSLPSMGAININPYNMDAFVIAVLTLGVYNL